MTHLQNQKCEKGCCKVYASGHHTDDELSCQHSWRETTIKAAPNKYVGFDLRLPAYIPFKLHSNSYWMLPDYTDPRTQTAWKQKQYYSFDIKYAYH